MGVDCITCHATSALTSLTNEVHHINGRSLRAIPNNTYDILYVYLRYLVHIKA